MAWTRKFTVDNAGQDEQVVVQKPCTHVKIAPLGQAVDNSEYTVRKGAVTADPAQKAANQATDFFAPKDTEFYAGQVIGWVAITGTVGSCQFQQEED
jgi:hypothetical protein